MCELACRMRGWEGRTEGMGKLDQSCCEEGDAFPVYEIDQVFDGLCGKAWGWQGACAMKARIDRFEGENPLLWT